MWGPLLLFKRISSADCALLTQQRAHTSATADWAVDLVNLAHWSATVCTLCTQSWVPVAFSNLISNLN